MAFMEAVDRERFSLLLLEPGEIYFEDYSVYYYPGDLPEAEAVKRKQKGRLKVCSKSLIFDPQDIAYPILKFTYRDCPIIEAWNGPLFSKLGNKNSVIRVECDSVVEMLEGGFIAAYVFGKRKQSFLFTLNYVKADDCLPLILQLGRAATLPGAEQASMIAAIVLSRQSRVRFDTSWLEDLYEKILLETTGNRITPLVTNPGRILLTNSRLYFQPYNNAEPWPVLKIRLSDIRRVIKRRYLLRHIGLEFYCTDSSILKHLFLSFKSQAERDELHDAVTKQPALKLEDTGQENMALQWQNGVISNYDYLLYVNSMADRSFNDLTQYPVFPWVIADYTSRTLDLSNPSVYRDLSKPIGAINPDRLQKLKERYKEMGDPKFLYGSHYSTPGFVLYYLVRKMPQYMLCLHNGRFDHPDRMFNSLTDTWRNVVENTSDFKELVPEFYDPETKGDFLLNLQNLNFGLRQDNSKVHDVELPPWAESPQQFVCQLREIFEGQYVSQNLHHWIDLVFGYKQRGQAAVDADNVFYYLTYEGSLDLDSIKDINKRYSVEVQITEFGQTPKQIFSKPHPQRHRVQLSRGLSILNNGMTNCGTDNGIDAMNKDELSNVCEDTSLSMTAKWRTLTSLTAVNEYKLHKEAVTDICIGKDKKNIFSVSQDTLLKMYSLEEKRQLRSIHISSMALSSCFLMPDGKTVILGSWDNYVYMYNVEYGKVLEVTMAHDDAVTDICWNNEILATSSWDSTAKVWHYAPHASLRPQSSAHLLAELDHDTGVNCVALDHYNTLMATGTVGGHLNLWDIATYNLVGHYPVHTDIVCNVTFSPDGQQLVSCSKDQTMKVIDVRTGTELFSKDSGQALGCVCWDGSTVLTGGERGDVIVWDLVKARQLATVHGHKGPITCIDVSDDGSNVVTGGEDRKIVIWQ